MLMSQNQLPSDADSRATILMALKNRVSRSDVRGVLAIDDDGVNLASPVVFEMRKPFFYIMTNEFGRRVLSAPVPELRGMELLAIADKVRDVAVVRTAKELVQAVGADFRRILVRVLPSEEVSTELKRMGLDCDCFIT